VSLTIIEYLVGRKTDLVSFHGQGADGATKAHVYHEHYHESDMKGVVAVVVVAMVVVAMVKAMSYLGVQREVQRGTREAGLVSGCPFAVGLDLA
jgi:hypothetical protein